MATALGLTPPGTIQRVSTALDETMREDVVVGRPVIAALAISRAGDMLRRGFFDLVLSLDRFPDDPQLHRAAWQAECVAIFGP